MFFISDDKFAVSVNIGKLWGSSVRLVKPSKKLKSDVNIGISPSMTVNDIKFCATAELIRRLLSVIVQSTSVLKNSENFEQIVVTVCTFENNREK